MAHVFYDVVAVCCAVLVAVRSFAMRCAALCFAECSRWSRASQLGPHKVPYVALSNSKERESKSHQSPPGRTCREGLRYCWPQDEPVRRAREFSPREDERTPIQRHRARPPADPWGAPAVSRAGPTPDRSNWSRQCEETRSSHLRVFDPVSGCLHGLPGSGWTPEEGVALTVDPAHSSSSPVSRAKRAHPCRN